jgi:hypothetical protein
MRVISRLQKVGQSSMQINTLMLSFQTAGIFCAEFDAPETDRFVRDGNASFSE